MERKVGLPSQHVTHELPSFLLASQIRSSITQPSKPPMMHRTAIFVTTHFPGTFLPCSLIDVMSFPTGILLASPIGFQPARSFRRWVPSFLLSLLMPSIKLAFIQPCVTLALLFLHNSLERLNMFLHQLSPKVL